VLSVSVDQHFGTDFRTACRGANGRIYALTARWADGQVWRRDVCLVHMARGIKSLQDFRPAEAGEPTITQFALTE